MRACSAIVERCGRTSRYAVPGWFFDWFYQLGHVCCSRWSVVVLRKRGVSVGIIVLAFGVI
jgi:hypothetical protein